MPTTSPFMFTSGPPELPGLIAASVWIRSSYRARPTPRPLPLTIPAVTVSESPNGWPTARTQSPMSRASESPQVAWTSPAGSIASRARSLLGSRPDRPDDPLLAARQRDDDLGRAVDDVEVGEDQALGRVDHEARAAGARGAAWPAGPGRGFEELGHRRDRQPRPGTAAPHGPTGRTVTTEGKTRPRRLAEARREALGLRLLPAPARGRETRGHDEHEGASERLEAGAMHETLLPWTGGRDAVRGRIVPSI